MRGGHNIYKFPHTPLAMKKYEFSFHQLQTSKITIEIKLQFKPQIPEKPMMAIMETILSQISKRFQSLLYMNEFLHK